MADDIALRLTTMIRAMQDVVIPAIAPDDRLATEQAHLVLASLTLIAGQQPFSYPRAMAELRDLVTLAQALADLLDGEAKTDVRADIAAAATMLRDLPPTADLLASGTAIRTIIDRLLSATQAEASTARKASALVIEQSARDIARGRAWIAAAGFDPEPDTIVPLADLL